jgi:serine/threonine protein kinase
MRSLLENIGSLSEMEAKFYAAELFLALDHLHSAGYIHRYDISHCVWRVES